MTLSPAELRELRAKLGYGPARYVTVELAATMTGLTPAAIRKRVERGQWLEGKEWRRAPDGRIWIDTEGVKQWVEQTA